MPALSEAFSEKVPSSLLIAPAMRVLSINSETETSGSGLFDSENIRPLIACD